MRAGVGNPHLRQTWVKVFKLVVISISHIKTVKAKPGKKVHQKKYSSYWPCYMFEVKLEELKWSLTLLLQTMTEICIILDDNDDSVGGDGVGWGSGNDDDYTIPLVLFLSLHLHKQANT